MTIYLTSKQYKLLLEVLNTMAPFYSCDFDAICDAVGTEYGATPVDIRKAKDEMAKLNEMGVVAPVDTIIDFISSFHLKSLSGKHIELTPPEVGAKDPFVRSISCTKEDLHNLSVVLDTYSRMMMGQFFPIFEQLDIPINSDEEKLRNYRNCRWSGGSALVARNALIPTQAIMGWNGSFGISNAATSDKSKLAYEMYKVAAYAGKFSSTYILHLSGQPLMVVDCAEE